jgi:hypothetical protein
MAVAAVRSNVAVVYSESSRREYARQARPRGETYRVTGARSDELERLKWGIRLPRSERPGEHPRLLRAQFRLDG